MNLNSLPKDEIGDLASSVKPGNLRNLSTSRGVSIGDSAAAIRRAMGNPTWQGRSKYTPGEKVWSYHRQIGTKDDGVDYMALFRLRRGKVTCIELRANMLPG